MSDPLLARVAHRPSPLPAGPWVMKQTWADLLFVHWRVPAASLRAHVPASLAIEEHDGSAWLGLTPFLLTGLRARGLPPLPGLSRFPEMNLRTYVRHGDVPGIWFFSLDAASTLAVWGARLGYRLPYFRADMRVERRDGWIRYESRRRAASAAELRASYRAAGPAFEPARGTLEHALTERYALFAPLPGGRLLRGDVHHAPWRLRVAEALVERNTVPAAFGLPGPSGAPLLHVAEPQPTLIWPPKPAGAR